ncbi:MULTISPECIES: ABC transporter ATP-binding protein [Halorussus]|uniref:ABC transporter ATP-binding protein n=1 Tax=Halorussus TaxID=1070314 RepID=UPI00209F7D97|nr:ABC transporter ATP-binding protein [Halorussus vallis]USZ74624.1 ABC transporter ATP-binding protein [Halorussus vallis]
MSVIEIDNLTKRFEGVTAVDGLSLSVEEGEVFGFLGPNGAGKSTTINAMLDFTKPTAGSVSVFGHDAHRDSVAIRRRAGLLLEGYGAYPRLTGREHVEHAIATKDADDDPDELLERVGLSDAAHRRAGGYSKGMRQRMALAVALVGDPDLLVFDEPSTGLDPNGARTLREVVQSEADRGATVFFSSHILEQVDAVADRIGILLDGSLAAVGGVEELRRELGAGTTLSVWVSAVSDPLLADLRELDGVREVTPRHGQIEIACDGDGETKLRALNAVAEAGVFDNFEVRDASLSDVFSKYTEGRA